MPTPNNRVIPHQSERIVGRELEAYVSSVAAIPGVTEAHILDCQYEADTNDELASKLASQAFNALNETIARSAAPTVEDVLSRLSTYAESIDVGPTPDVDELLTRKQTWLRTFAQSVMDNPSAWLVFGGMSATASFRMQRDKKQRGGDN